MKQWDLQKLRDLEKYGLAPVLHFKSHCNHKSLHTCLDSKRP